MPTGQRASEKPVEGCWAGQWFDCVSRDTVLWGIFSGACWLFAFFGERSIQVLIPFLS